MNQRRQQQQQQNQQKLYPTYDQWKEQQDQKQQEFQQQQNLHWDAEYYRKMAANGDNASETTIPINQTPTPMEKIPQTIPPISKLTTEEFVCKLRPVYSHIRKTL